MVAYVYGYIAFITGESAISLLMMTPLFNTQLYLSQDFYVVTLRRGRTRTREQLLLQNYKA